MNPSILLRMVSTLYHESLNFDTCLKIISSDLLKSMMATDPGVDTSFSLVKYNEPVLLPPDGSNGCMLMILLKMSLILFDADMLSF